jgi:hypothetical protein
MMSVVLHADRAVTTRSAERIRSGYTGLLFEIGHFDSCPVEELNPVAVLTGACDEPIPWDIPGNELIRVVECCCEY